jgi:hypothetical protein
MAKAGLSESYFLRLVQHWGLALPQILAKIRSAAVLEEKASSQQPPKLREKIIR